MPEGEIRADPWVVTEAVANAVAVLERPHTSTWLFPATLFTDGRDGATILRSRVGGSRSETRINHDIAEFLAWVETYCAKHGRSDHIPPDPVHPVIYSARLRRTLAWFIVRGAWLPPPSDTDTSGSRRPSATPGTTPRASPTTSPSKTGRPGWTPSPTHTSASVKASRPAAETYRHRVQAAARFAGRVPRTKRHANTMLANPDLDDCRCRRTHEGAQPCTRERAPRAMPAHVTRSDCGPMSWSQGRW